MPFLVSLVAEMNWLLLLLQARRTPIPQVISSALPATSYSSRRRRECCRQRRYQGNCQSPLFLHSRFASHEKSKKHKENATLLKQLMEEEEGAGQAASARTHDHTYVDEEDLAQPSSTSSDDKDSSDGDCSDVGHTSTSMGHDQPDTPPISDSPRSDDYVERPGGWVWLHVTYVVHML